MNKLKLNNAYTYIIGVSGGPDSMALFDMCIKQGIHVICAHMNYQKRDSAQRDMEIVKKYCEQHGITCRIRMQNKECKGNFQAFAREMRYAFYRELCEEFEAYGVLLAHQLDDHLETYLMQKQQNRLTSYYGIQEENRLMGCRILRPLLNCTKQELETYCIENQVPYGIDESNLSDHYTRNRIRHQIIEPMSMAQKQELVMEIVQKNETWFHLCKEADTFLADWNEDLDSLRKEREELIRQVLIHFIWNHCHQHPSKHEVDQLLELVVKHANGWTRMLFQAYVIYSEYGKLCIDTCEDVSYAYTYHACEPVKTPYFTISFEGSSVEALTLYERDYPITIRNAHKEDEIILRFGTKKLNRWFIDRKIPKKDRRRWPVVVNAQGNVILVPKIGCDIAHFSNNPTCFVLK